MRLLLRPRYCLRNCSLPRQRRPLWSWRSGLHSSPASWSLVVRLRPPGTSPVTGAAGADKNTVIALATDRAPGAFKILPASFQDAPASVLAQLGIPEAEKRRLAEKTRRRHGAARRRDAVGHHG